MGRAPSPPAAIVGRYGFFLLALFVIASGLSFLETASNPFIARWIPTPDESMVVIRFRDPHSFDFPYLLSMIHNSFMSRANSIVIPGGKLDIAMQLILTPMILKLVERGRRAVRA